MYTEKKNTFDFKSVILQFLFVALFIFILMWLFPLKSDIKKAVTVAGNSEDTSVDLSLFYDRVFNENVIAMKDAAKSYFTTSRLPKNVGDKTKMTLGEMLDKKIILPFVDSDGKQCDLNESYVEITKNDDEFVMKVNLKCSDQENYLLVYMGCYDYCQTAICEKNQADIKTPVVYSGKTNQPIQNVVASNNSSTATASKTTKTTVTTTTTIVQETKPAAAIINNIVNNVTNVVNNIVNDNRVIDNSITDNSITDNSVTDNSVTNININIEKKNPTPTPKPTPTPEPTPEPSKEYLYEYKKVVTTDGKCTYSDWSAEQTTAIAATSTREVKVRTVKKKVLVGYNVTTGNDISKPIYGTKEVGVGYKTTKYCKRYGYTSSETIGYGNYEFAGYVYNKNYVHDTDTVRYVLESADAWLCKSQCQGGVNKTYKMYVRKPVNASKYTCLEYGEESTLITANQTVITGYEKKEISKEPVYETQEVKYYSSRTKTCTGGSKKTDLVWSTYNDTSLLNNGYSYTGNKKEK